ncbi:MAG: hypothetical protein D8M60_06530 [Chloroflexi bacterium]|nr:hypothetical protein [Chloroflexota bacterium]
MMIFSLYIFAFELLKAAIVNGVKSEFVDWEYSKEQLQELKNDDSPMGKLAYEGYANNLTEFEQAIGEKYNTPDNYLLIPCATWLKNNEAISSNEVNVIMEIRNHRNQIAHEMPKFLFDSEHNLDLELFAHVRDILSKIDLFWFRMDIHFNPETWEELDSTEISDNEVISTREAFLHLASRAVEEYAKEIASSDNE